jgi:ABC-2 type transport system permease protein
VVHLRQIARTLRQGSVVAYADFKAFYTWKTWLGGWVLRLLTQVGFYSLLASWVGDRGYVTTVVLGAVLLICVTEPMMAVASTSWDRLFVRSAPLLAASPVEPGIFYAGRSVQWPCSAVATTSIALVVMSQFFDVTWSAVWLPILLLLVIVNAFTGYCVALLVGAMALVAPGYRNVMSSVAIMSMTAFCGAFVPVDFWPRPVSVAAQGFPATHGIEAVRLLQSGAGAAEVATPAALTILAGAGWFIAAFLLFRWLFANARRTGALLT